MPITLVTNPQNQPVINLELVDPASKTPQTAGTTRKENTSSTPATSTELVTTTPKELNRYSSQEPSRIFFWNGVNLITLAEGALESAIAGAGTAEKD